MTAQNAINWFEIPSVDFQRAVKFYGDILGAELQVSSMGDYKMGMFPMAENSVGGAIIHYAESKPSTDGTLVYLNGGDDLSGVLGRVEAAGGNIAVPKTQITPEIGYFAIFIDTEGNKVGLHSPN